MNSQWKEPIYHPNWGLERCLLCSIDRQDASSEMKGLTGEYHHIVWVRIGLQICIYYWHFQVCPLILRKHDFIFFKKKHQKMIAFKTILIFPKCGGKNSPPPIREKWKI